MGSGRAHPERRIPGIILGCIEQNVSESVGYDVEKKERMKRSNGGRNFVRCPSTHIWQFITTRFSISRVAAQSVKLSIFFKFSQQLLYQDATLSIFPVFIKRFRSQNKILPLSRRRKPFCMASSQTILYAPNALSSF
jgi:hypothetical protein